MVHRFIVLFFVSLCLLICFGLYIGSNTLMSDGVFPSQIVQFDIVGEEVCFQDIFVSTLSSGERLEVQRIKNMYTFETGQLAGGEMIVFGVKKNEINPLDSNFVSIEWKGIGKSYFSINDINSLPSEIREEQERVCLLSKTNFIEAIRTDK